MLVLTVSTVYAVITAVAVQRTGDCREYQEINLVVVRRRAEKATGNIFTAVAPTHAGPGRAAANIIDSAVGTVRDNALTHQCEPVVSGLPARSC